MGDRTRKKEFNLLLQQILSLEIENEKEKLGIERERERERERGKESIEILAFDLLLCFALIDGKDMDLNHLML